MATGSLVGRSVEADVTHRAAQAEDVDGTEVSRTLETRFENLVGHTAGTVNVHSYGSTGTHLAAAAAAATAAGRELVIAHPIAITTAVGTISCPVRMVGAGKLVTATGGSVTLTGPFVSGLSHRFDTSAGGTITFSAQCPEVYPQWWGAVGDGVHDDTAAIQASIDALQEGGAWRLPRATAYKITAGISVIGKGRTVMEFGGEHIDASLVASGTALYFREISHSRIGGIFLIGNTSINGVEFGAASGSITIYAIIGKIHVSGCNIGVFVGDESAGGYQFSDSVFDNIYGADCNIGVYLTGENTLAMRYNYIAAYNNSIIGVMFKQGGGSVGFLGVAANGSNVLFGSTDGTNHGKLNRWDISSGYSEEGVDGEIFINSVACTDTNPFREQIVIRGFRCTPFSSTNTADFVRWRLNGTLLFSECTFTHGQQLPVLSLDHNTAYRTPQIVVDNCVVDCAPKVAPQVPLLYQGVDPKHKVKFDAAVDNGMSFWVNAGAWDFGLIPHGIYTSKADAFISVLRGIADLYAAWDLRQITSNTVTNLVLSRPSLTASASIERRDVWADDGLFGLVRNGTTSKNIGAASSDFAVGEYTFGMFLRSTSAGTDETDYNALGGALGMRLGIGFTGGSFVRCMVGGYNAQAIPTYPSDPHLVIGRYAPSVDIDVDAINLRTGEILHAATGAAPATGDLTWTNTYGFRTDLCVRGMSFLFSRALTDAETKVLLQSAMALTDSWRL